MKPRPPGEERSVDVFPEPASSLCPYQVNLLAQPLPNQTLQLRFVALRLGSSMVSLFYPGGLVTGDHLRSVFRRDEIE